MDTNPGHFGRKIAANPFKQGTSERTQNVRLCRGERGLGARESLAARYFHPRPADLSNMADMSAQAEATSRGARSMESNYD